MTELLATHTERIPAPPAAEPAHASLLPEPPVGSIVADPARLVGHEDVAAELRMRWAAGHDTLLVGPAGAGKGQLGRDAAARTGRATLEVSVAELRGLVAEEREAAVEALGTWLGRHAHGLLLVDTDGDALALPIPEDVPVIVTSTSERPGVTLDPPREPARLDVAPSDVPTAIDAVRAWAEAPNHPAAGEDAIVAAVRLADRFDTPGALPGAATALLRAAAHPERPAIDRLALEHAVVSATALPLALVSDAERERLNTLEDRLRARIVGQRPAVSAVARAIRRRSVQLGRLSRPQGVFLFVGPTGVGKTELARALASEVFGGEHALVRFDCAEYQRDHEVARLIGAPPGYVGHERPGRLITELQRGSRVVLLFDEVEKAHWAVHDLLLGALDSGVVHGAKGEKATLWNAIVVMTSNLGSRAADQLRKPLGFGAEAPSGEAREKAIRRVRDTTIRNAFRPEFLNRLDAVIHFDPLGRDDLDEILSVKLATLETDWLARYRMGLEIGPGMRERIVDEAVRSFGAGRSIDRQLEREVYDRLTDALLEDGYDPGTRYRLELDGDDEPRLARVGDEDEAPAARALEEASEALAPADDGEASPAAEGDDTAAVQPDEEEAA